MIGKRARIAWSSLCTAASTSLDVRPSLKSTEIASSAFSGPRWRRPWLPVSTTEWMPSDSMAEEPVMAAVTNLATAISALPASAA